MTQARYATDDELDQFQPELGVSGITTKREGCIYELCPINGLDYVMVWVELVDDDGLYQIVRPWQLADAGLKAIC